MEKERVRIADIAEELGLSTATVSNVIHGKTGKVSGETVRRVHELVEKRGYIPSMAGILLAQNNSRIIGVVVKDHAKYAGHVLEDGFVSASLNALSGEMDKAGFFMMIKVTTQWDEIVRFASMWNMEGLVLIGFCEQDYRRLRESMHIPFVVYDGYFEETGGICNLTIDHYDGGWQVGKYLKEMGHKKVLCIADNSICMDLERMKGCADAMEENSVDFMQIPVEKRERMIFYEEKEKEIREYTAVFAASDYYAVELLRYFQEKGIRVPEEISVVGFDDSALCQYCFPSLTTVRQDARKRAQEAIGILQNLKAGKQESMTVKLPVFLVERGSVKNFNSLTVNQKEYSIIKLLGKGKGGYSYLAGDKGKLVVVKQIHHEPCDYYQFGDKMEAELRDYRRLKDIGIRMPELIDFDPERERIVKEYIEGETVYEMVLHDGQTEESVRQVKEMCRLLYPAHINIDYFPTNFVMQKGELYYIDYECNDYMEEWNFENWGIKYWSKTEEFLRHIRELEG